MTSSALSRLNFGGAEAVLEDSRAGERALRFALRRVVESLRDVLRIAVSRGTRIREGRPG
ncbi:hypothetical protein [Streptomyces poriticola]|uniref:hypothetical protein n=1 Tax=Streptomyces poriticola TaxID=3120506 RepID=UPI002FCE3A78